MQGSMIGLLPLNLVDPVQCDEQWQQARDDQANVLIHGSDQVWAEVAPRISHESAGLPPSDQEVVDFVKRWQSSGDHESLMKETVDRLLDSREYAERWGRHWLDVARYAESSGKDVNLVYPHAWRYRDYVIDAFHNDKPFDQFVREQIAGDLLPAETDAQRAEQLIATTFLAIGEIPLNERNPKQGASHHSRSIYLPATRSVKPAVLAAFDPPDTSATYGARDATNVPSQALFMLNSDFVAEQSQPLNRHMALRLYQWRIGPAKTRSKKSGPVVGPARFGKQGYFRQQ